MKRVILDNLKGIKKSEKKILVTWEDLYKTTAHT